MDIYTDESVWGPEEEQDVEGDLGEWEEALKDAFVREQGKKRRVIEETESELAWHLLTGFCYGAYNARQVVRVSQLAVKDGGKGALLTQLANTELHNASRAVNQALQRVVGSDPHQPYVRAVPLKVEKHLTEEEALTSTVKDS